MGFLSSSPQLVASICADEHFADRLRHRCAKSAELQAAIVLIEPQLAQTAVEVGGAAIRVDSAQIEWQRSHSAA